MRKNIYIKDEDAGIFEKAEQIGGESLSAVIAEALRRYVAAEEAKAQDMKEITIEVGTWHPEGSDDVKKIKFLGRKIGGGRTYTTGDSRGIDYDLYLTAKGKILVIKERWSRWQGETTTATYTVCDSLEQVDGVPGGIVQEAADALDIELAEYLDI